MIIFLSCVAKKNDHPCCAREMYWPSTWFKSAYLYAASQKPNAIYILSAKYGLLVPDTIIKPYQKTLCDQSDFELRRWAIMVTEQIRIKNIDLNEKAIFLCGINYRKYIKRLFSDYEEPVAHLGIGSQVKYFKEHTS